MNLDDWGFSTKFVEDTLAKNFDETRKNMLLEQKVKALTLENATLKTLLKEATDMLEQKCELKERMDALEARINENEEKQAKWNQANVNGAESSTKVAIDASKKN